MVIMIQKMLTYLLCKKIVCTFRKAYSTNKTVRLKCSRRTSWVLERLPFARTVNNVGQ